MSVRILIGASNRDAAPGKRWRPLPSQEVLKGLLDYDPATGSLTWRPRPAKMFRASRKGRDNDAAEWNRRYAGRRAFVGVSSKGYHYGCIFHRQVFAHRVIWKWMTDEGPDEVDHENGVRTDNRWSNLRSIHYGGNARNAAIPRTNTSGRIGVCPADGRWRAYIGHKSLGTFENIDDAAAARAAAERELGFHPNHGRLPS